MKHLRHEGALGATKALEGVVAVPWKYYESNVHERPYGAMKAFNDAHPKIKCLLIP